LLYLSRLRLDAELLQKSLQIVTAPKVKTVDPQQDLGCFIG
jgi:hypothetical protein